MSDLFTTNSLVNQIALANMRVSTPHAELVQELEIAKLLLCHLVHAQGGAFTITDSELTRDVNRFTLQISHQSEPGLMVIKVKERE